MAELNDYGPFAHLYDIYVNVDVDVQFFVDRATENSGPVLELMAGTGRVSKHLANANPDLTCVDVSRQMVEVLMKKFVGAGRAPKAICADVRSLPLDCRFELALIPFNSFSELTSRRDREQTLAEINRVLCLGEQGLGRTIDEDPVCLVAQGEPSGWTVPIDDKAVNA